MILHMRLIAERADTDLDGGTRKRPGFVSEPVICSELALGWCTYNGDHMSMYAGEYQHPEDSGPDSGR